MSTVDDLIGELFPEKHAAIQPGKTETSAKPVAPTRSSWDSSDSDTEENARGTAHGGPAHAPLTTVATTQKRGSATLHRFDDDSDDDGSGARGDHAVDVVASRSTGERKGSGAVRRLSGSAVKESHLSLFAVPFPTHAVVQGLPRCTNRCYVTNVGLNVGTSLPVPTAEELRLIATGKYDSRSSVSQMMARKAAYYVQAPATGNACADGGVNAPCESTEGGGCRHIVCRKCNYVVVRLQGCEWVDGNGSRDLYLTTRNYYPDWCRLASALPVGLSAAEQTENGLVLRTNPQCAAYCCQCSWLSVYCKRAAIETKITVVSEYADVSRAFATRLPLLRGETRRPPVWICMGHNIV